MSVDVIESFSSISNEWVVSSNYRFYFAISTSKPVEWVSALIERFEDQVKWKKNYLILIFKFNFSYQLNVDN
jgi:hypothetical protein